MQLDKFQEGLMSSVLERTESGELVRKAGIMAVVARGGVVRAGDVIREELPPAPHRLLRPV